MSQLKVNSIVPSGGLPSGASGGGIIQVVQYIESAWISQSRTPGRANWSNITDFQATITPRSTSNKILVLTSMMISPNQNHFYMTAFRITRNGSVISGALGDTRTNFEPATISHIRGVHDDNGIGQVNIRYLDSPSSTSALTYRIQQTGESSLFYMNRNNTGNANTNYSNTPISTLMLMEVSG